MCTWELRFRCKHDCERSAVPININTKPCPYLPWFLGFLSRKTQRKSDNQQSIQGNSSLQIYQGDQKGKEGKDRQAKATRYFGGGNFIFMCVAMVLAESWEQTVPRQKLWNLTSPPKKDRTEPTPEPNLGSVQAHRKWTYWRRQKSNLPNRTGRTISPRNVLKKISAVDTQTAVLVSSAEVWIWAPDTQTPILLVFWVYTADFGLSAWGQFFPNES